MNTLMYCMGDEADDILSSLGLLDNNKFIKTKPKGHFVQQKNIIYEHARYNQ